MLVLALKVVMVSCFTDYRFAAASEASEALACYGLLALESVLSNFLCLCLPYLLQRQLAGRVNVDPGKALLSSLKVSAAASLAAALWAALEHSKASWLVKMAADVGPLS